MGLDQNLYLCKKQSKNGVKEDNLIEDWYFRKNYELHRAVELVCLDGASTNVEYIHINKEQWKEICRKMEPRQEALDYFLDYTGNNLEWIEENLEEFKETKKELEALDEFENGAIYYYSWW